MPVEAERRSRCRGPAHGGVILSNKYLNSNIGCTISETSNQAAGKYTNDKITVDCHGR